MRLTELDPQWIIKDGKRVGFTFISPVQHNSTNKTVWRQSVFAVPTTSDEQFNLLGDAPVQHCNPGCGWKIEGELSNASFDTITVTPSIDGSQGGLWHGHITNGEIK